MTDKSINKQELSGAEQIKSLADRGFQVTRIFQPGQNNEYLKYLDSLKAQGKDFAVVIDKDLEGTADIETGKIRSRVIKVLEK